MTDGNEAIQSLPMVGGELCLDFTNTTSERHTRPRERLQGYGELVAWAERVGLLNAASATALRREAAARPADAERVHTRAIALREAIYRLFSAQARGDAPRAADVEHLNAFLREVQPRRRLVREGDHMAWEWSAEGDELERMLAPIVWSAAELLTSEELSRVKECTNENCTWLFVDASRNRSRRWCDMKDCGNRAKARRHYVKRKASRG